MRVAAALVLLASPAAAQQVVVSPGPGKVAVTLYRAPDRGTAAIEPRNLQGYALVTETRTVALPAGPAVVRFEGVAGNILPESAVVGDLPTGVIEKNLDADLLSPRTLYDRTLGRRVLIRRTDRATGRVVEEQATIRSAAAGAAVLEVGRGIEALRCSGVPEALVYPEVPAGLSPRPTLSIRTDSARAVTATLTLSYLAGGFDWQADYVVTVGRGGAAELFAWVTLASSDVTSFVDAGTAVVAGKPQRRDTGRRFGERQSGDLRLSCYPITPDYADYRVPEAEGMLGVPPPPPPPPPMMAPAPMMMDIVVTGARKARQEELGDLKLYRFPDRVTVASQAQKQVALLAKPAVPIRVVYVSELYEGDAQPLQLVLRLRNRAADGLGVPLPSGQVTVFQTTAARPILIGTTATDDKAVGEDVEFKLAPGPAVSAEVTAVGTAKQVSRYRLIVTNANPWSVAYEAKLRVDDAARLSSATPLTIKDGRSIWATTVPANGTATLNYAVHDRGGSD